MECSYAEAFDWLKAHGATDVTQVHEALNQAYNFQKSGLVIAKPKSPRKAWDGDPKAPRV